MTQDDFDKFWMPEPNSGCWLWIGSDGVKGYGRVFVAGRTYRAHRFSFELANGPIPAGMMVCHKCDVRCCVNPDHLFLGTAKDNYWDAHRKDRAVMRDRHGCAKLTSAAVDEIRRSSETTHVLGARFGVDPSTIGRARRGANWSALPAPRALKTTEAERG